MEQKLGRPTVGIIVPNYNDGRYLHACLQSVLRQTDPPDELIVIDDGSTDDSDATITSLLTGVPYARYFRNETNRGATETSNRGLSLATSEYLIFLSANDFIDANLVAETREFFSAYPQAGICAALINLVDEDGRNLGFYKSPMLGLKKKYLMPEAARKLLVEVGTWTTGATVSYNRKLLIETGGFDPAMKGFADLLSPAILAGRFGAGFIPRVLCSVRLHKGNFLGATLADSDQMRALVKHFSTVAPQRAPELFSPPTLKRFLDRIYFAMFRVSAESSPPPFVLASVGAVRAKILGWVCRLIPPSLVRLRVLAAFLIIRGRDFLPFLWRRSLLGWCWILQSVMTGRKRYAA